MVTTIPVLITRSDGGVSVMSFVLDDGRGVKQTLDAVDAAIAKARLDCVSWRIASPAELPSSREYRNAWVDTGTRIDHDMVKARDIHRDKLRRMRAPKLAALDVAYQRADEDEDRAEKARVAAEKRRLRDLPADPRIEQAETIEHLAAIGREDG